MRNYFGIILFALNLFPLFLLSAGAKDNKIYRPADNFDLTKISTDLPTENGRAGGIIIADVNDDNQKDFLITKSGHIGVYDISGKKLWSKEIDIHLTGKSETEGLPGLHAPGVQVGDVDNDGATEVLFLNKEGVLLICHGVNGEVKYEIKLQVPEQINKWEHLVIANFRGQGDHDLLLQSTGKTGPRIGRYIAAYAVDELITTGHLTKPLWSRDDFLPCMHNGTKVADLDFDGRDEVIGGTIIGPNGDILYQLPANGHIDSIYIADVRPDIPGLEVVALEEWNGFRPFKGDSFFKRWANRILNSIMVRFAPRENHIFVYNYENLIWRNHYKHKEPQNAAVGDFDNNRQGLEIWCRSRNNTNQEPFVFDAFGGLIATYQLKEVAPHDWTAKGIEEIFSGHWFGDAKQVIIAKERHTSGDIAIIEPISGEYVFRFAEKADRLFVADIRQDWREEIIVLSGNELHLYTNTASNPDLDHPSLWNQKHYIRNKMTWNYYSP